MFQRYVCRCLAAVCRVTERTDGIPQLAHAAERHIGHLSPG